MEGDVRVRAVVMTRDDSSGGWVPLGGGGLSHVVICKGRSHEGRGRREYIVRGERLRDRAPVLECAVQKGLVYNKVNPIFHHWRVEERKFGLTFQSPADAISFERGLQAVIDKLERGSESPSSSTPEEGDTEDDGQAVSGFILLYRSRIRLDPGSDGHVIVSVLDQDGHVIVSVLDQDGHVIVSVLDQDGHVIVSVLDQDGHVIVSVLDYVVY
ncbi:sprouty-related, EVH1 domain-containing protein 2-like [Salvelinus sp. IW2-2015]|uniref:sprouty-related, EVH1 domain-containing protein 2-like n=1 Tax=Salvelinus sp. IW2-2015 TaxID=2691554 RepID=UPI000CEAF297|nr:sprouty-related, EVH1 domain-containing protein 2-like [Salvelinus alpinus]